MNSRLDEMQAAVLRIKLGHLDADNDRRRALADAYRRHGANGRIVHPHERAEVRHVYHQYVVRCEERDRLAEHLKGRGIGTAVLYPVPVHRQPAYAGRVSAGEGGLPVSEGIPARILCLPVWPEMSDLERDRVVNALRQF
jgi:dTDP-4-amino-4,6-dideoxygalactose transaminase